MIRTLNLLVGVLALCVGASAQWVNGAGATFPNPIYQKWFTEYSSAHPGVQINYQSLGSGAGIRQIIAGTVDFGASDSPMTDEQQSRCPVTILHIPTVLGAVVPSYNIPGVKELRFTPELLANIFLGKISDWSDPAIAEVNPGVRLPNLPIVVVHRSDASGSTYVLTDYLSKVSPEWSSKVGNSTSVKWPVGPGSKGTEGVAGEIRQISGSIGYIELIYAVQSDISYGLVRNKRGNFVKASLDSITEAANTAAAKMPSDYRVSITDPEGKDAYPIASFTWLLIPRQSRDAAKGKVLHDFLLWMLADGQREAGALTYVPLPKELIKKLQVTVSTIH